MNQQISLTNHIHQSSTNNLTNGFQMAGGPNYPHGEKTNSYGGTSWPWTTHESFTVLTTPQDMQRSLDDLLDVRETVVMKPEFEVQQLP